jgi:3-methyladenine DNA glycosylase AlkD
MTMAEEVLQTLESLGSEQARKTYRRHGVKGPLYGVSYADQGKLAKKLKTNHELALALWASGVHDARILALKVADPKQATEALLDGWMGDVNDYVETDALSDYIGQTKFGREKMDPWMQSPVDWVSTVGWNQLAILARNDQTLPDSYFETYMSTIERDIHSSQNRTRHAMNNAIIAIGTRNAALEQKAFAAAARIGKVIVDHGDTDCKTPDATAYIKKVNARKAEKVPND